MGTRTMTRPRRTEHEQPAGRATGSRGRVVVGVDGSEGSAGALRWAAEEARMRGAVLHVVHAWEPSYVAYAGGLGLGPVPLDERDDEREADQLLRRAVTGAAGGRTEVRASLTRGPAVPVLVEAASGADLLVVGSRGRGGFAGLVLGSVSQECAHVAPCPVVIVRARRDG